MAAGDAYGLLLAITQSSTTATLTVTQPATAHIATNPSVLQPATARIANTGVVKTQPATSRISLNRAITQTATAHIATRRSVTQTATARISTNTAANLVDNFNDNTIATQWDAWSFSSDGSQITERNGKLTINHANVQYNAIFSRNAYDLTGSSAYVQLTDPGNQTQVSHAAIFLAQLDTNNKLYIQVGSNTVTAWKVVGGTQTQIGTNVTYSSTSHQYLRIREASGTIFFDTAPDSSGTPGTWTNQFSVANPFAVTALQLGMQSGNYASESSGSYATWDNFNGGGTPTSDTFAWKGYTWQRRQSYNGTSPTANGNWSPSLVSAPDTNNYVTLTISNPSGTNPTAAEFMSVNRTWGYGTYTTVVGTELDTLSPAIVFGGMFTFDPDTLATNNEIDINETSAWGVSAGPVTTGHTYWTNNSGVKTSVVDPYNTTSDAVTTHVMIWSSSSIIWRSYAGTGTGGTLLKQTTQTTNLPTPATERIYFNIWAFQGGTGTANAALVPTTSVVLRDFSYSSTSSVTFTQPAVARIATKPSYAVSATARIANNGLAKTQPAKARVAINRALTQPALGRISLNRTVTQPAIARIAKAVTKTQPATGRIARLLTKLQTAVARIGTQFTKLQPAVSRIAINRTTTQPAVSRVARNLTKTQTAVARIAVSGIVTKTQPATSRVAVNKAVTQSATGHIAVKFSMTLPATAHIGTTATKTQPAIARIAKQFNFLQTATANIIQTQRYLLSATARIYQTFIVTKSSSVTLQLPQPEQVTLTVRSSSITCKLPTISSITVQLPQPTVVTLRQPAPTVLTLQKPSTTITAQVTTTTTLNATVTH